MQQLGAHQQLAAQPDATLAEWGQQPAASGRWRASRGPHQPLAGAAGAGPTAQQKSLHAAERDPERVKALQRDFIEALAHEDVTRFKSVGATSVNLTYTLRYGRALGIQRVNAIVPLPNGPNVTVAAALTP